MCIYIYIYIHVYIYIYTHVLSGADDRAARAVRHAARRAPPLPPAAGARGTYIVCMYACVYNIDMYIYIYIYIYVKYDVYIYIYI